MQKRKITDPLNVKFKPFDRYGAPIDKMSWHEISYDEKTGIGTFLLKLDPGAQSIPHEHIGYEEFLVLQGEMIDADNTVFKKGDFVTFEPSSCHSSSSPKGCLLLVFMRGFNRAL